MSIDLAAAERQLPRRRPARRGIAISCHSTTGLGPNLAVELRDLSEEGLGVILNAPLTPGRDADVELTGPYLPRTIRRRVEVVWCQPDGEGRFWAGLRLRPRFSYQELAELVRGSFSGERPSPLPPAGPRPDPSGPASPGK
jgi:hypothetical protein